ncbi:Uma2 family endonuclease [Kribbella sp. NPDC026611]|uniref:Uma2 family endonuclease n=1 Tax=Kribbella sp. NPDC026611 TaxID=3154911 RepID=UPI0033CBC932
MTEKEAPAKRPKLTLAEFDALPDDGERRELLDGAVLVKPSPEAVRQRAAGQLALQLPATCPEQLEVFFAPFDYRPSDRTCLQPDLMVCRVEDVEDDKVRRPLLLAVEILSPSTRAMDLLKKRRTYEEAGVGSYWIFEPEEAVLTVLELESGRYVERTFKDDEVFEATRPYPMRIVPGELVRRTNRSAVQ